MVAEEGAAEVEVEEEVGLPLVVIVVAAAAVEELAVVTPWVEAEVKVEAWVELVLLSVASVDLHSTLPMGFSMAWKEVMAAREEVVVTPWVAVEKEVATPWVVAVEEVEAVGVSPPWAVEVAAGEAVVVAGEGERQPQ